MGVYRFSGVPQKITFNAGSAMVEFVPDAECVIRYQKAKDTEFKFFVLTSESDECIGRKLEDPLTLKVVDGKLGLFSVGVHVVVELEEIEEKASEVTFDAELPKKFFRIVSLAK